MNTMRGPVALAIGVIMLAGGVIALRAFPDIGDAVRILPYLAIAVGAGLLGSGLADIVQRSIQRRHVDVARRAAIEESDERNVAIREKSKAKAFDLAVVVFGAALLALALAGADMYVLITLVLAYLIVVFAQVFYASRYQREM